MFSKIHYILMIYSANRLLSRYFVIYISYMYIKGQLCITNRMYEDGWNTNLAG